MLVNVCFVGGKERVHDYFIVGHLVIDEALKAVNCSPETAEKAR